jgi:hypothetical protein
MKAKKLNLLLISTLLLTGCQNRIKNKILDVDGNFYVCKKVPKETVYNTSPAGENPQNGKKAIVLNREFFKCKKIKTEAPEPVLKTTYLGAITNHN